MFNCKLCINHDICVKTCPQIEEILIKQGIYSKSWIRPKLGAKKRNGGQWREIPFSSLREKDRIRLSKLGYI